MSIASYQNVLKCIRIPKLWLVERGVEIQNFIIMKNDFYCAHFPFFFFGKHGAIYFIAYTICRVIILYLKI